MKKTIEHLDYLDVVKNSGTGKYMDILFQGEMAITNSYNIFGEYSKILLFFKNGYFFTIMLISDSEPSVSLMFTKLKKSLNIK